MADWKELLDQAKDEAEKDLADLEDRCSELSVRCDNAEEELLAARQKITDCDLLMRALGLTEQDMELLRPKLECGALKGVLS